MRFLFFSCIMFAFLSLCGQDMRFTHLDQKQGLSQNTATSFLQDRDGFMWVGTQDGLNRYDGYSFVVFRNIAGDTNSLPDNYILTLAEDNVGNIWIGTRNGLCVYVKREERFYRYYSRYDDRSDFHASVKTVYALNEEGVVYRSMKSHLLSVKYFPEQHRVDTTPWVSEVHVQAFTYCPARNELAFLSGSVISIGQPGKTFRTFERNEATRAFPQMTVSDEYIFISDSLDVKVWPLYSNGAPHLLSVSDAPITALHADREGNLWIGTTDGIRFLRIPLREETVMAAREDRNDYFSLAGSRVESIYSTRENITWIGTVGGVNVYDPLQTRFSVLKGIFSNKDQDAIWFVLSAGNVTLWSNDNGLNTKVTGAVPRWVNVIPKALLYSAGAFDSKGRLWLGTKNQGVIIVDTLNATVDLRYRSRPEFSASSVMDLCSNRGKMWIASVGSLCFADENDLSLYFFHTGVRSQNGLSTNYFTALEADSDGNMFVASARGIFHFDRSDTNFTVLENEPGNTNSLAYNIVNDIKIDGNVAWLATMGYGLDRLDLNTGEYTHYTTTSGLANNTIYGIEIFGKSIWLSSNEGLILFDPGTGASRNFTMRDGLPSNEFVINKHAYNTYTGQLLFGSANGLIEFDPDEFESSPAVITPALSRVLVNYRPHPFYGDSVLRLSPDERNVSFEFTAIDFRNQDKIRYAYKLEGFDSTWHDIESYNRLANFTNLPYGDYTFMVRYRVSGEAWSEKILRVGLFIETPFYAAWWFRIVLIIAGIVLVALIVRYISQRRLRKQLEELKLQEEIRNEKERISRDLHDNVGAQLTYVISSLDNLSYTLHKKQTAVSESARLEQLGEFARGTMDQLRESIWAINSEQISLAELTGKWKQHLSQLSETKPLAGRVTRTGEDVIIKPTVAIEIHRIVQEAISNAFRHSGGDAIEINVHNDNRTLEITVSDNGVGIPPAPEKAGHYGLQNMKKRAAHIHASLDISSGAKGGKITLRWKLN